MQVRSQGGAGPTWEAQWKPGPPGSPWLSPWSWSTCGECGRAGVAHSLPGGVEEELKWDKSSLLSRLQSHLTPVDTDSLPFFLCLLPILDSWLAQK